MGCGWWLGAQLVGARKLGRAGFGDARLALRYRHRRAAPRLEWCGHPAGGISCREGRHNRAGRRCAAAGGKHVNVCCCPGPRKRRRSGHSRICGWAGDRWAGIWAIFVPWQCSGKGSCQRHSVAWPASARQRGRHRGGCPHGRRHHWGSGGGTVAHGHECRHLGRSRPSVRRSTALRRGGGRCCGDGAGRGSPAIALHRRRRCWCLGGGWGWSPAVGPIERPCPCHGIERATLGFPGGVSECSKALACQGREHTAPSALRANIADLIKGS